MDTIDIASPGANEASLKAALSDLVGQELISSATITTPVEWIDFALPSGYVIYILFANFTVADAGDGGSVTGAFSFDGGITFVANNIDYNSYQVWVLKTLAETADVETYDDGLMLLNNVSSIGDKVGMRVTIYPVEGAYYTTLYAEGHTHGFGIINNRSITPGRPTHIRLMPEYGTGSANPPGGAGTFTAGTFTLFGVPS